MVLRPSPSEIELNITQTVQGHYSTSQCDMNAMKQDKMNVA